MKRIRLLLLLCVMGIFLAGCKSKEAKVQEQLDLGSKYMAELDYENAIVALNKAIKIDPNRIEEQIAEVEAIVKAGIKE